MNPGPKDDRGRYDPELASITFADAIKRRWIKYPERCPIFWRPALKKMLKGRAERYEKAALDERFQATNAHDHAIMQLKMARSKWFNI